MTTNGTTNGTTDRIHRYFDLSVPTSPADLDAYVALFAPDCVVHDDGHTHHGRDAVRAWRSDVPDVTYELAAVEPDGARRVATAEIAGDFPGSPVVLRFAFTYDAAGLIAVLTIAP